MTQSPSNPGLRTHVPQQQQLVKSMDRRCNVNNNPGKNATHSNIRVMHPFFYFYK